MYATLVTATLLSAFSVQSALAQQFVVDTPAFTQCAPATLTWSNGVEPFDVAIVPAADPCNSVVADLGEENNGWSLSIEKLNITAGESVMISIIDGNNEEAWSGAITVGGGDSSCLDTSSADDATTLRLTTTYPTNGGRTAAAPSESATIVGAANAGELGQTSGAFSVAPMSAAFTALASFMAVGAALLF